MLLTLDQKRLINRALRYSIAHLNEQHQQAQREGRNHEAAACLVEAEKLTTLREDVSNDISEQLKRASKGVAIKATAGGFTVDASGVFSDCVPRAVNSDSPEQPSGSDKESRGSA